MGHNRGGSLYSLQEGGEGSTEIDGLFTPQSSSSPLFLQSLYINTAIIIIITIITILRILFECISYHNHRFQDLSLPFDFFPQQNSPEKKLELPSTQGNNNVGVGFGMEAGGVLGWITRGELIVKSQNGKGDCCYCYFLHLQSLWSSSSSPSPSFKSRPPSSCEIWIVWPIIALHWLVICLQIFWSQLFPDLLTGHYSNINHHQLLNNWEGSQLCWGLKSTILHEPRRSNYWRTYVVSPSWGCTSEPSPAGGPPSPAPCQPWSGCLPPGWRRSISKYVTMSADSDHHHQLFSITFFIFRYWRKEVHIKIFHIVSRLRSSSPSIQHHIFCFQTTALSR